MGEQGRSGVHVVEEAALSPAGFNSLAADQHPSRRASTTSRSARPLPTPSTTSRSPTPRCRSTRSLRAVGDPALRRRGEVLRRRRGQEDWSEPRPRQGDRDPREGLECTKGSDRIYSLPDGTRLGPVDGETPAGGRAGQRHSGRRPHRPGQWHRRHGVFPQAPNVATAMQNGDFGSACWYFTGVAATAPEPIPRHDGQPAVWPDMGKLAYSTTPTSPIQTCPVCWMKPVPPPHRRHEAEEVYTTSSTTSTASRFPASASCTRPLEFYEFNQTQLGRLP